MNTTISHSMGFSVLRATPLCSSDTTKPIFFSSILHSHPTSTTSLFTFPPPSTIIPTPLAASPGLHHHHLKRGGFRGGRFVAMAAPGSLRKSEEEWHAILSPEQFRILRQKGLQGLENMTSSLVREFTTVQVVGLLYTGQQQNSILVVAGQRSIRVFPEP
ncbi:Peptide methionine sulfoxide reductase B2 [Arachis hypogaea]|nr:Peptide methionine sulfoxide reductase B2 [Arachis hypogaea]